MHTHKPEQKNTAISSPQNHCASTKKLSLRPFQDDLSPITFRLDVRTAVCILQSNVTWDTGHTIVANCRVAWKPKDQNLQTGSFLAIKKALAWKYKHISLKKCSREPFFQAQACALNASVPLWSWERERERGKRYISNSLSFLNRPLKLGVTPYFLLCFSPPVTFSFFVQLLYITDCNF